MIDRYVSPEDKDAMVASCDCYVSLHRAEGFGLPLAEAMFLGKPTIATAYSGNLEFQNEENSYLVGFRLVPIGGDGTQYPANGVWAEPDVEQAAALMRRVFHDQAASRAVGARAAADIRRTHSLQAAGVSMERRLERIARELELWPSDEPTRRSAAAPLIERGPVPPARSTFGFAGRPARRLLLRALKPLTSYQRAVDSRMVSELEQARDDLAKLRALELRVAAARAAELARSRRAADPDDRSLTVRVSALERKLTPPHALVPLERFESPVGRVEGFRQSMNGRRPADPYLEFENVFRGPERVVRDRQQRYLQLIGHRQPVLDLGCGRGEFLEVLRQDGLSAHGVDLDRAMVEHCRSKGLDVSEADVVDYLETLSDASVGVVFASHVIEHLPYPRLLRFLNAARAKLRPAGLLIVETPNPHYPLALRNFWIDPTHQHPLFPEVVLALCRLSGFTGGYIWHPGGIGDPDQDRTAQPDYAIVAEVTAPAAVSPVPGAVSRRHRRGRALVPRALSGADTGRAAVGDLGRIGRSRDPGRARTGDDRRRRRRPCRLLRAARGPVRGARWEGRRGRAGA